MRKERNYQAFELEIQAIGYYLNRTFCMVVKLLNKELREANLDLQHAEFSIIRVLTEIGGMSQSQLAQILGKERSGVGRTISSLEKKGYISRDSLNGSTNLITLTEKGRELAPVINEVISKVTEKSFHGFSQKSRGSTIKNLNKIFENARMH